MRILGIESSCDDTSVALIEASDNAITVLAEKTASQIDVHKKYGGVVPEVAGRMHAENIVPVVEAVMDDQDKPDVIAVTSGPGLITGLLVGVEVAKNLSYTWDVPLIGVNHIEGHIHSPTVENTQFESHHFPAVCLVVSGGHTELLLMKNVGEFELIGKTRDDAAGECFDKVGKLIGIDYPGGPEISRLAQAGNTKAVSLPRPMLDDESFDCSFSGLKTAALYHLQDHPITSEAQKQDFCASFQQAIVDVLVTKTIRAIKQYDAKSLILGGGVSANKQLRTALTNAIPEDCELKIPKPQYSTDNGAMIAAAAYHHARKKEFTHWKDIEANPNWKVWKKRL